MMSNPSKSVFSLNNLGGIGAVTIWLICFLLMLWGLGQVDVNYHEMVGVSVTVLSLIGIVVSAILDWAMEEKNLPPTFLFVLSKWMRYCFLAFFGYMIAVHHIVLGVPYEEWISQDTLYRCLSMFVFSYALTFIISIVDYLLPYGDR